MSQAIQFDTLAFTKKLKKAGVSEEQAEIHAESIAELVNTSLVKVDDLEKLEVSLKHKIDDAVHKQTLRFGAMQIATIGILATLMKLL